MWSVSLDDAKDHCTVISFFAEWHLASAYLQMRGSYEIFSRPIKEHLKLTSIAVMLNANTSLCFE